MRRIATLFAKYKLLNNDEKGLLFIRGVRAFESLIKGIFVNIYIFVVQENIYDVLWLNILGYICTTMGYRLHGLLLSQKRVNVKRSIQLSFLLSIVSYIILIIFGNHILGLLGYVVINGISRGFFYSSMIYFESHNIGDRKTDIYTSFSQIFKKTVGIIGPLIITGLFLVQDRLGIGGYTLIFMANVLVIIGLILHSNKLSDHIIKKIPIREFHLKKFKMKEVFYYLTFGLSHAGRVIISLILIYVLVSEVNIGLYETALAILSIGLVAINSIKTNPLNRKRNLSIIAIIICANIFFFGLNLTVIGLVIYTIIDTLTAPLLSAMKSAYYYDVLENKADKHDKLIRVLNTDFWTQTGRILFLLIVIGGIYLIGKESALYVSMMIYAFTFLLIIVAIRNLEKGKKTA